MSYAHRLDRGKVHRPIHRRISPWSGPLSLHVTVRRLLVGLVLLAGVTACGGGDDDDLIGIWTYDSYTVDGETVDVEVGSNAAKEPYVEFGETMSGTAGCNGFGGREDDPFEFERGKLRPGDIIFQAAECTPVSLMDSEMAFRDMVWNEDAIDVTIDGAEMTWRAGGEVLRFTKVDEAPEPPAPPPQTGFGPLDCSPDLVERTKVPAEGTDAEEVAFEANPRVSGVDVENPHKLRAEGYDANGEIILVVAFDDIRPETFSIYTCP